MTSFLSSRIIFIVLATIFGLVVVDIKNNGSFEASKSGIFLNDSGALHYGDIAWSNFRAYSQQGYRWSQKNVPVYVTKIQEGAMPYLQTLFDWLVTLAQKLWSNIKLLYGYFLENKPLVEQWINQYAPGVIDMVNSWLKQAWAFFREYSVILMNFLLKFLAVAYQWLMEDVFVGSLSPENLHRYTMEAFNTTQQLASQTLSWLNNKLVTDVSAS